MALTQEDRELLAVVKYYNKQRRRNKIIKLITKLFKSMNGGNQVSEIARMTGFNETEVREMLGKKVAIDSDRPPAQIEYYTTGNLENFTPRFSSEVLYGRIAQKIYDQWDERFKSGERFMTQKEIMEEMGCSNRTAQNVLKALERNRLIKLLHPANPRAGYVVK